MNYSPSKQQQMDRELAHRGIGLGWAWGELMYDRTYKSNLEVTNDCPDPRPVETIVGSGISPYLSIAEVTLVPGKTTAFKIPITITTPPVPNIIVPPGGGAFDWTPWVISEPDPQPASCSITTLTRSAARRTRCTT